METEIVNLNKLPLNINGIIQDVKCEGNIKRRLLDLGLVKGTNIRPVLVSPSRGSRAFEVRGTVIAIREEDAEYIKVEFFEKV